MIQYFPHNSNHLHAIIVGLTINIQQFLFHIIRLMVVLFLNVVSIRYHNALHIGKKALTQTKNQVVSFGTTMNISKHLYVHT